MVIVEITKIPYTRHIVREIQFGMVITALPKTKIFQAVQF